MNAIFDRMETYKVTVIREAGNDPITGQYMDEAQESLLIDAENEDQAFRLSQSKCKLTFRGQIRRTLIDGDEYNDPRY